MQTFVRDPDSVLDYKRDWTDWLAAVDDTIVTSTWTVPDGITMDSETHDETTATIWLSGGTLGEKYELTNRIVTADGRIDERTFAVVIRER